MKIVKRVFVAVLVLLFLVIGSLAVIPYFFKDELVQFVKDTANENVNAKVDFGEFDLSLLSSYPNFLFEINDVSVIGVDTFELDTLVHLNKLNFEVNLSSVFAGNYEVNSFELDGLTANARVLENGLANWDVAPSDSTQEEEVVEEEPQSSEKMKFNLNSYKISNANIVFDDQPGNIKAIVANLNHEGVFRMDGDNMFIDTKTLIDGVTFEEAGVKLANKVKIMANAELLMDLAQMKFEFKNNEFALNDLKLAVDGWVSVLDDTEMDINISAKNNKFQEVLSLIPSVYKKDIAGVTTKGDFSLAVKAKGTIKDEMLPAFSVDLSVHNGFLKYPDLPESVQNIQIELKVNNKTGVIDHTIVDLQMFHFEVAKNPIDLKFYAKNLESDPDMKGEVKSKLNLESLASAIPMESEEEYKGRLNADFHFAGKMSSIEKEEFEKFDAEGTITLMDFLYKSPDLPDVNVKNLYMNFTPQYFELGNLDVTFGKSDLTAKGKIDNILPYVFDDDTLSGQLSISSQYFDLNELMTEDTSVVVEEQAGQEDTASAPASLIEIPGNIDFVLASSFKKIDYDNMPITDLVGNLTVRDSKVSFEKTSLKILGGEIELDGEYNTQNPKVPSTSMQLKINNMDVPTAFKTFNTVEKMAPIAKNAKGQFSTSLNYYSTLTQEMTPDFNSMAGTGDLLTKNLVIENHKLLDKIAAALKNNKLKKLRAEDLKIKYEFKDGKVHVAPFDLKLGKTTAKVHGWNSFDQTMEYTFEFKIPRSEFGGEANQLLSSLEGQAQQFGAKIDLGEFVLVNVIASGAMDDPKIKVVPKGMEGESGGVKEQAKEAIKAKAEELKKKAEEEAARLKKEAEDKAKAEVEKAKKEAEAKAKKEADRIKKELERKAEAEKKKQTDALKDKGKDLLKGWGR